MLQLNQFRTQAGESGVREWQLEGLASLPLPLWLPDPPSPASSGPGRSRMRPLQAPQWLAPCQTSQTSRARGRWRAGARSRNKGLSCVLCSAAGASMSTQRRRTHQRAQLPKAAATGPTVWTRPPTAESGRPQHLPEDYILEGLPGNQLSILKSCGSPRASGACSALAPLFLQSGALCLRGIIFDLSTLWWTSKLHVCF